MHGFGRSLYNQQIEYGVMISRDIDKSVLKRNLEREKEIKKEAAWRAENTAAKTSSYNLKPNLIRTQEPSHNKINYSFRLQLQVKKISIKKIIKRHKPLSYIQLFSLD